MVVVVSSVILEDADRESIVLDPFIVERNLSEVFSLLQERNGVEEIKD